MKETCPWQCSLKKKDTSLEITDRAYTNPSMYEVVEHPERNSHSLECKQFMILRDLCNKPPDFPIAKINKMLINMNMPHLTTP